MPLTVFVTAFDQHAVQAFEANALDYILKPFGDERMQSMLARAKQRLRQMQVQSFGQSLMRAMSALPGIEGYQDRIAIKSDGITRFLEATRIDWIEAAGAYVTLHVGDQEILHRHSLASLLLECIVQSSSTLRASCSWSLCRMARWRSRSDRRRPKGPRSISPRFVSLSVGALAGTEYTHGAGPCRAPGTIRSRSTMPPGMPGNFCGSGRSCPRPESPISASGVYLAMETRAHLPILRG